MCLNIIRRWFMRVIRSRIQATIIPLHPIIRSRLRPSLLAWAWLRAPSLQITAIGDTGVAGAEAIMGM